MTGCLLLAGTLGTLDWAAIGAYFAVILGVAWWVVEKTQRHRSGLLPRRT